MAGIIYLCLILLTLGIVTGQDPEDGKDRSGVDKGIYPPRLPDEEGGELGKDGAGGEPAILKDSIQGQEDIAAASSSLIDEQEERQEEEEAKKDEQEGEEEVDQEDENGEKGGEHAAVVASSATHSFGIKMSGINEEKLAEALTWIENIASCVKKTQTAIDKILSLGGVGDSATLISNILVVTSQTLAVVAQGIGLATAIVNFAISFFLPSEMDIIRGDISALSTQIHQLNTRLKDATTEIKASVEFNNWLTTYVTWEFTIRNGEDKMAEIMQRIHQSTNTQDKLSIMHEFITYFENSGIENAIRNIHRISGEESTVTTRNIFELYIQERGHHPKDLSNLMLVLSELMLSGSSQIMTYTALKYGVREAGEIFHQTYKLLDDIRFQYEQNLWYIMRDVRQHAIIETTSILDDTLHVEDDLGVAKDIQTRLFALYGWYKWAVVVTSGIHTSGKYETRGNDFFYLHDYGRDKVNVVVVWQDMTLKTPSCTDSMDGDTLVFLADSQGKTPHDIITTDVMTSSSCWSSRQQVQDYYLGKQITFEFPQWIATTKYTTNTDCEKTNACSNHGQCHVIPSTPRKICVCDKDYFGVQCEGHTNIEAERMLLAQLALLRLSYGSFSDTSSVISTHMAVQRLDDTIDDGHDRIIDILDYLKSLISNGEVLNKAQYINTRYSEMLNGDITDDEFGQHMEDFLQIESLDYILVELQNTLLGIGVFDNSNSDILTAYKKAYIANRGDEVACGQQYTKDVTNMIQKLAGLDEGVSEAMILYMKWRLRKSSSDDQEVIMFEVVTYLSEWASRYKTYTKTWKKESCPQLSALDLIQNHCGPMLSYEGLTVRLSCENQKEPSHEEVTCVRTGDRLEWDASPQCDYVWSTWMEWSSCSKTCDGGQRDRMRRKLNGDKDKEKMSCNTQECCQKMYGRRKCGSGECITVSQSCDGVLDCTDGSDEQGCNYIKSGDQISLKSSCDGYLNCQCTQTGCGWWFGKKMKCKAGEDDEHSEFLIYNQRGIDTAIQHGDQVALLYRVDNNAGYWLSCPSDGSGCAVSGCPGITITTAKFQKCKSEVFKIMSPRRIGQCSTENEECLGQPIQPRDVIYLKSHVSSWLSGEEDEVIKTSNCPGDHVNSGDAKCLCEMWTMYLKQMN